MQGRMHLLRCKGKKKRSGVSQRQFNPGAGHLPHILLLPASSSLLRRNYSMRAFPQIVRSRQQQRHAHLQRCSLPATLLSTHHGCSLGFSLPRTLAA
jgi:hypothetical protein